MKQICIIYENCKDNYAAIQHNQTTLENIFGDLITVKNYDLLELSEGEILEGDAFLISNQMILSPLRHHIRDFKKIILMERSIQKCAMPDVMKIPHDSDVLVVNDSCNSSSSTTYQLYEIGINHLNLIPYDNTLECKGIYRHIRYAITPGETSYVPSYIENVVNLHYRIISFSTILRLVNLLQFDIDRLLHRLIPYMNSIAMVDLGFHDNYRDSFLKNQMLDQIVKDSEQAILVVTDTYQHVYSNEQANHILNLQKPDSLSLPEYISESLESILQSSEDNSLVELHDEKYVLQKTPMYLTGQLIGYCFTFQGEKNLRQMEINLNTHLRQKGLYAQHTFQDIIHVSKAMDDCIKIAKQAAITDYTVLIRGESGTGKELLAQSIHNYSPRKSAPFVAINCAALPESLLESQLFGYEEGAFTGAQKKGKPGLFEQAHLGTIFLDEIGDISLNLQTQLLRVLQEKQIMRIGSDKIINVDVRIIAATNQDLEKRMKEGLFRSDLFYRLNVIPLLIQPLRLRREDILPLLHTFLGNALKEIPEGQAQQLISYSWPGNIRQLENVAIYYNTFHDFPPYLDQMNVTGECPSPATPQYMPAADAASGHTSCHTHSAGTSLKELSQILLALIEQHTEPFHGIGRTSLLHQLLSRGISISDGKLREVLSDLEQHGLITVSRGRCGCRITEDGHRFISDGPA